MKKNIYFLISTFLLLNLNILAQTKKEIIETLKIRIDSLHSEIKKRDINFEKAQAEANSNKEATQQSISKLEKDIAFLKGQMDVVKKTNDKLVENNTQLTIRVAVLKDSVTFLQNNLAANESSSNDSDFNNNAKKKFEKVKSRHKFQFEKFTYEKNIIKDSLNIICGQPIGCVSFLLTEQILVMSHHIGKADIGTYIIDLNSGKEILAGEDSYIFVEGFDKKNGILEIVTFGMDDEGLGNGQYFIDGTYNIKTKIFQFGKKNVERLKKID